LKLRDWLWWTGAYSEEAGAQCGAFEISSAGKCGCI